MKRIKFFLIILVSISTVFIFTMPNSQKSLADIYRTGKVRFIPELTLDDNSMPEDIFFESPIDLTFDIENNIYVCDYQAHNIKVFDSSGKFMKTIGREGQGPGEFRMPFQLAFAKGRLAVWELRNRRLSVLTSDGEFLKSIHMSPTEGWPRKIRALPNGDFVIERMKTYVGDNERSQECNIDVFSPDLEHKKTIYTQSVWENKYITSPVRTNIPQPFCPRVYWGVTPDGRIIVGYSEKYIIEIHDSEKGKLSTFNHAYEPVKINDKDREKWFAGIVSTTPSGRKQGAPDYIVKNAKFPKFKPAFQNLLVDSEGNILICRFRKESSEDGRYFDAFEPNGNFINNVQVIGDRYFPSFLSRGYIRQGFFWTTEVGEDGIYKVVKYRISE